MNKLLKLSKELPFLLQLENLKREVDSHHPLSKELESKVFQKLRLDWNFNSNAIEGNSFTRGETVSLLMEGVTAKGKPLKDALDIKGHNEAIDFMLSLIKDKRSLNEADIRALHKLVLGEDFFNKAETEEGKPTRKIIKAGQYKTQPNHVKTQTGEVHYYSSPEETPSKMKELVEWYNKNEKMEKVNPIVLASIFHHKFVEIHPFDDGNGRMTRILTNFILLRYGYPVSVIKKEDRNQYYSSLSQADNGEIIPIIEFISSTIQSSLEIILRAINGESIAKIEDVDKEIQLFKQELGITQRKNTTKNEVDFVTLIYELIKYPSSKFNKFTDVFNRYSETLIWDNPSTQVNLSEKNFGSLETFQTFKGKLKFPNNLRYVFSFSDFVYDDKSKPITVELKINFKRLNYKIIDEQNKTALEKLYTDEILDHEYVQLIRGVVRTLINRLKVD